MIRIIRFGEIAAVVAYVGYFGGKVSHVKDDDLATYKNPLMPESPKLAVMEWFRFQRAVADELKIKGLEARQATTTNKVQTMGSGKSLFH